MKDRPTYDKAELNSLLYRAAYVVTESMGVMQEKRGSKNKEPLWKKALREE